MNVEMILLSPNRRIGIVGAVAASLILHADGLDWYIWLPAGILTYAIAPIAVAIVLQLGGRSFVGIIPLVGAATASAWIKVSLVSGWLFAVACGIVLCILLSFVVFRIRAAYERRRLDQMIERLQRGDQGIPNAVQIDDEVIDTILRKAAAAPDEQPRLANVEELVTGQVKRNRFNTQRAVEMYKIAIDDCVWDGLKNLPSGRLLYRAYQRSERGTRLAFELVDKFKTAGALAPIEDQRRPRRLLRFLLGA
jgi:hypothetical protein